VSAGLAAGVAPRAVEALTAVLEPGQDVVIGQGYGAPRALIAALGEHGTRLAGSHVFVGMLLDDVPDLAGAKLRTFFPSGPFGTAEALLQHGVEYVPLSLYELASGLRSGAITVDVALAQATPARGGRHSLGVTVDYVGPAVERAGVAVLETGAGVPWTGEASTVAADPVRVVEVACDARPIGVQRPVGQRDQLLAEQIARLIPDGATLQFGMGGWVAVLVARLAGRRDLHLHTGLLGDWLVELMGSGALDGHHPIVGTAAGGTPDFYRWLDDAPAVELAPADVTHDPRLLESLPRFHAINSVLEVDLRGRVNTEVGVAGRRGGVAGLADYAGGAARNPEGVSIVALPATAGERSRIVASIAAARPSLPVEAVDVVVTEHGSADLRGRTEAERARALVAIAAPQHRSALERAAEELELL
jgi:acyl-CoA hydrolase